MILILLYFSVSPVAGVVWVVCCTVVIAFAFYDSFMLKFSFLFGGFSMFILHHSGGGLSGIFRASDGAPIVVAGGGGG